MKKIVRLLAVSVLFVFGCVVPTPPTPQMTQLQIRELQTRSYETNDVKMVMKAMLNVLQDDGFIVKNADTDLGFLTATKEIDVEDKVEALLNREGARWRKNLIIEATANVSDFGSQCRVRINFQMKYFDNLGGVIAVLPAEDQKFYQNFFAKVDKGIFIQKEKL